ncbi:hypothetical protein KBC03_01300 [Patescibacteria group bacterium]|nr:hypothetical protein [Patescibacteria group bacterium]
MLQNYQRRSYEYNIHGNNYRIKDRSHSHKDIVESGEHAFFSVEQIELIEKDTPIGMLYCFTK